MRSDMGVSRNYVSQWSDLSGANDSNRNFVASVQKPTFVSSSAAYNNQPVVNFNSSLAQELTQGGLWSPGNIPQPYTIIMVGNDDALQNTHRPWLGDANVNEWYVASFPNTSIGATTPTFGSSTGVTGSSDVQLNSTTFDTGAPVIYMAEFNDNSSTIRVSEDAAEPTQFWGTLGAAGKTGITTMGQLSLGWANGTAVALNGNIAEIVVIFGLLATAQRRGLFTYLQQRYAIAVSGLPSWLEALPPSSMPNLGLWCRADQGITAGVNIWADQSGQP